MIWAAKGTINATVEEFCDAFGEQRAAQLHYVACDGQSWSARWWPNGPLSHFGCPIPSAWSAAPPRPSMRSDERRGTRFSATEEPPLPSKEFEGLRWMLMRNWENLSPKQKGTIRDRERANKRRFRGGQRREAMDDSAVKHLALAPRHVHQTGPNERPVSATPSKRTLNGN